MKKIQGGVCAPIGFKANGVHCGIRKNKTKRDEMIFHRALFTGTTARLILLNNKKEPGLADSPWNDGPHNCGRGHLA